MRFCRAQRPPKARSWLPFGTPLAPIGHLLGSHCAPFASLWPHCSPRRNPGGSKKANRGSKKAQMAPTGARKSSMGLENGARNTHWGPRNTHFRQKKGSLGLERSSLGFGKGPPGLEQCLPGLEKGQREPGKRPSLLKEGSAHLPLGLQNPTGATWARTMPIGTRKRKVL